MWHTYKKTFLERDRDARNVGGGLGILPPPPSPPLSQERIAEGIKGGVYTASRKNCGVPN